MKFERRAGGQSTRLAANIHSSSSSRVLQKRVSCHQETARMSDKKPAKKPDMKWAAVLWYIHLHVLGLYGVWLLFTSAKWMTVFFTIFITTLGCLGVTAGAHRLWAHRTYEAAGPLRIFLMLAHTLAGVGSIYDWVLYHRLHHKYYGTDKDPYKHEKGFIYSHYLSNLLVRNIDYEELKRDLDMRDIEQDGYVWFQKKFYWPMFLIFGLILPLNAPLEYWDEGLMEALIITAFLRFAITVNTSCMVNSARLIWSIEGEKKIPPNSISVFFVRKSFWPAYHYMIPWDYQCGEFGTYGTGFTTFFIKMWHELDLVDYLKTADTEDVREMLHQVAKKKTSLADGLDKLKEASVYKAKERRLLVHR